MATQFAYPLLTSEEFLAMDFGERKAELDRGVIRMMAGGIGRHSRVQGNIFFALALRLRGSGCFPHASDMAVQTRPDSIRYPDVSVYCERDDPASEQAKAWDNPRIVFEVLSNGTARTDLKVKLEEYRALPSIDTIVFVDIGSERVHVHQRTGRNGWADETHDEPHDVMLPSLRVTVPHDEIFARD